MVGYIIMLIALGGINFYVGLVKESMFSMWVSGFCISGAISMAM